MTSVYSTLPEGAQSIGKGLEAPSISLPAKCHLWNRRRGYLHVCVLCVHHILRISGIPWTSTVKLARIIVPCVSYIASCWLQDRRTKHVISRASLKSISVWPASLIWGKARNTQYYWLEKRDSASGLFYISDFSTIEFWTRWCPIWNVMSSCHWSSVDRGLEPHVISTLW